METGFWSPAAPLVQTATGPSPVERSGAQAEAGAGIAARAVLAQVVPLDEARSGARQVAGDLEVVGTHHHGMHRVVDPEGDGLARQIVEAENGDGLVRRPFFVEAEPQSAVGRPLAAIGVDVGGARADAEARRLELRLRAPHGLHGGILHAPGVGRGLGRGFGEREVRRAVVVDRRQQQVFRTNAGLRSDARREIRPDRVGGEDQFPGDERGLGGAVVQHDGAHVDMVVDGFETLRAAGVAAHGKGGIGRRRDVHAGGAGAEFGRVEGEKQSGEEQRG